ncbi:hypothetical protein [Paenibacillus sp. FSL P4-0184]|uniref:hypothetical protein n=1 Tax=Paenibacillus sp. FSL P4-0184 TaxID=2921632 RepID=UPI0030F4F754
MNQKRLFNEGWEFAKSTLEVTNAESLDFHPVDLPHDWLTVPKAMILTAWGGLLVLSWL